MSNNQKISFWNLIKRQKIVIPIIQRDYAQGREGKEYLRQRFLKELKDALDEQDRKSLTLDFIYGTENNNQAMSPLDGQQRLTTLWLLHWYIAYKTKNLESETVKSTLKKFSYETRVSSREFCEKLCELPYQNDNGDDISLLEYIQQQTWFYSVWNQDPTIQAMLRMLCGTKINDPKTDNDIADGIDELLGECTDGELSRYWTKLTCEESEKCPISFYQMTIGTNELPLSDDLYIKMNARGKQLTSFENFKADLIDWMNKEENKDLFGEGENEDDQDEQRVEYASLIDNGWTDVFWKYQKNGRIDEIFFAFINRYFLNAAIIQGTKEGDLGWNLYGEKSDDSKLSYRSFGLYESILKKDKTILQRLKKLFENIKDNNEIRKHLPGWFNKEKQFEFIPIYKAGNNGYQTTTLTQPQRVLFYAVCRYFEECKFDETTFRHWMRIACNLIENPNIDTIDAMIGRMKLIDELSKHLEKSDIYDFLNGITGPIESDAAKEQMDEEIKKVHQIKNGGICETTIIEAENYAFFHGAIRFLFTDENGDVNWSQFDTKFENAKKYFDEKGVHDDYKFLLTRALISQCESWNNQIYEKQIFDTSADNWKKILLSNQYKTPIHNCLIADDLSKLGKKNIEVNFQGIIDILINEKTFTQVIITSYKNFRFLWNHNYLSLYARYGRNVITFDANDNKRNEFLTSLANIEIKNDRVVDNVNLFWGWDIIFSYNKYDFQWNTNGYIYLMENGRLKSKNETATEETEKYYCFQVDKLEKDDLKSKLDDLTN